MGKRIQSNYRFTTRHLCRTHLALALVSLCPTVASAEISASGDVDPVYDGTTDPWGVFRLFVGRDAVGSLDISNGGVVNTSLGGYIGFNTGSNGTVTVTDAGSQWNNSRHLFVGYNGIGQLNIESGGLVTSNQNTWTSYRDGTGTISFNNGTLTTNGLNAAVSSLQGTGTINTNGIVSDVNLVFDAVNGLQQQLILNALPGQNITMNLDAGLASSADFGAGYAGSGSLTIQDGKQINNRAGYLGYKAGSTGNATISGAGSQWNNASVLYVGYSGSSTLDILSGGFVSSSSAFMGLDTGSTGTATVDGIGSTWDVAFDLTVGNAGTGTLNIQDAGIVNVTRTTTIGTGQINFNNGTLNTSGLQASAGDLLGTGTVNTNTLVSDLNLTFNAANGLQQQVILNALPGQNVTLNIDASTAANNQSMGVGYEGSATLDIADGIQLTSTNGTLGYKAGADGTANLSGAGTRWDTTSAFSIGRDGDGTFNLSSGAVASSTDGYLGQNAGSTGTATIDGAGSQWNNTEELFIGNSGTGTLNIQNGGTVTAVTSYLGNNAGSSGTATVDGVGSQWTTLDEFYAGRNADATLNIQNGGRVVIQDGGASLDNDTYIGQASGVTGTVNVTGTGSELFIEDDRSEFYVGDAGTANLNIQNGGKVTSSWDAFIGNAAGSTGIVRIDGAGSQWNSAKILNIGVDGVGSVSVTDGAKFSDENPYSFGTNTNIARNVGSTGSLEVDGIGSEWNQANQMNVGANGTGELTITSGGVVNVQNRINNSPSASIATGADSIGTVSVDGNGSQWNVDRNLSIAGGGNGILNITNGGVVYSAMQTSGGGTVPNSSIGGNLGSSGSVTVDGVGSLWHNGYDMTVGGLYGTGTLNIQNGGIVNSWGTTTTDIATNYAYNTGTINFNNGTLNTGGLLAPASTLLGTGTINTYNIVSDIDMAFNQASGTQQQIVLNVLPGQNVTINYNNIQAPEVNILSFLGAGFVDTATMTIEDGVVMTNRYGYLGYRNSAHGTATVTGPGSHWNNINDLHIGVDGKGTLNILSGGLVSSLEGLIGYDAGSEGTVNVDGVGSQWNLSSVLRVGRNGDGELNILNGGVVNNNGSYSRIGDDTGNFTGVGSATVNGSGSRWNTGALTVGQRVDGTLTILNGGVVSVATAVRVSNFSGVTGAITVDGNGSLLESDILRIGQVDNGMLTIQNAGAVVVRDELIMGSHASLHLGISSLIDPFLVIDDDATLAGTIKADVAEGTSLTHGDTFILIDIGGTQTGLFDNAAEGGLLGTFDGVDLFLTYTGGDGNDVVAYAILAALLGDADGDGDVDAFDITAVEQNFGNTGDPGGTLLGDADGDGDVDAFDITAVEQNFGNTSPASVSLSTASIPEPNSLVLLGVGGLLLTRRRRMN